MKKFTAILLCIVMVISMLSLTLTAYAGPGIMDDNKYEDPIPQYHILDPALHDQIKDYIIEHRDMMTLEELIEKLSTLFDPGDKGWIDYILFWLGF